MRVQRNRTGAMEKPGRGTILIEISMDPIGAPGARMILQSCPSSGKGAEPCNLTWTCHWVRAAQERGDTSLGKADAISTGQFPKRDSVMSRQLPVCLADGE